MNHIYFDCRNKDRDMWLKSKILLFSNCICCCHCLHYYYYYLKSWFFFLEKKLKPSQQRAGDCFVLPAIWKLPTSDFPLLCPFEFKFGVSIDREAKDSLNGTDPGIVKWSSSGTEVMKDWKGQITLFKFLVATFENNWLVSDSLQIWVMPQHETLRHCV